MKTKPAKHFTTLDAVRHDAHVLAEDAESLLEATKEVVDDKVKVARTRLAETVERSREFCASLEEKALENAKLADKAIQEHPYQTAFVALGVGAILGFLVCRRP